MRIVVVGGGQAALSFAAKARQLNEDAEIVMIGAEPVLPYQRPPLSKAYLAGTMPLERLALRDEAWFVDHRIEWRGGVGVEEIDRAGGAVRLADGSREAYDALVLATGATARRLPNAVGGELAGVHVMRDLADADALAPKLKSGGRMLVVGGGYIGLEAAAVARSLGMEVVLLEAAMRILGRVASEETADYYRTLHRAQGVVVREDAALDRLTATDNRFDGALLADGSRIDADVCVVGIGVSPNAELADEAGLAIDNGVAVDRHARTSDPAIFAVGDCASFPYRGERVRLESVPHAIHHAEVAAQNLLGEPENYEAKPWFWSDQYDVKLQIAGLNAGYESTVTRPGKREGAQSVWYYRGEELLAVDAMNDAPAFMTARKLIEAGRSVPPTVAADPGASLRDFV